MTATTTDTTPVYGVSDDAIQLWVRNKPGGQTDSVVTLEWCISPAIREELIQAKAIDPQLLLIVVHDKQETDRYLVPLAAERWHIRFRYPDENTVYAVVVWEKSHHSITPKKLLFRRKTEGDGYRVPLIAVRDTELESLRNERAGVQRDIRYKIESLDLERSKLTDGLEPLDKSANAEEKRLYNLRRRLIRTQQQIAELEGSGPKFEPVDHGLIIRLEAELVVLAEQLRVLDDRYKERSENQVTEAFLQDDFAYYGDWDAPRVARSRNTGRLEVVIPRGMFAKEPPRWQKYLGTRYSWPRPAIDQCQMRRRALFTLATIWPAAIFKGLRIVVTELLYAVLLLVSVFLGYYDMNFKALRHPTKYGVRDLWAHEDGAAVLYSRWIWKRNPEANYHGFEERAPVFWLLNPVTLSLLAIAGYSGWRLLDNFFVLVGMVIAIALALMVLVVAGTAIFDAWADSRNNRKAKRRERRQKRFENALKMTREDLTVLTCNTSVAKPTGTAASLPRRNRVAFVAHDIKTKVCKPFAG